MRGSPLFFLGFMAVRACRHLIANLSRYQRLFELKKSLNNADESFITAANDEVLSGEFESRGETVDRRHGLC